MSDEFFLSGEDWDAHCCIQGESGYFQNHRVGYRPLNVSGKSLEEVASAFVARVIERAQEGYEHDGVQIRFLWFKDPVTYDGKHMGTYEFDHLRQAVMKHEYARHVGTWVNANTGNKMDGWMLVIPVEKDPEYDNDF